MIDFEKSGNNYISLTLFKLHLYPLVYFSESREGFIKVRLNDTGYLESHKDEFDDFLTARGFVKENGYKEFLLTGNSTIPDGKLFCEYLEDIANNISDEYSQIRASYIINAVNDELFNGLEKAYDLVVKAKVLITIMSNMLYLKHIKGDIIPKICIKGFRNKINYDHIDDLYEMLYDLGLDPFDHWLPGEQTFITFLENYINDASYLYDNFECGEDVISSYYKNIE